MSEIARAAGTTVANLYVYFDSKLLILYAIYEPWLDDQLQALHAAVLKLPTPRTRLRRLITGLWGDIPAADHCFANSLIDALSGAQANMGKPNSLLARVEEWLSLLLADILPPKRAFLAKEQLLSHILWMAFDGFVVNHRMGDVRDIGNVADLMTALLLAETGSK